MTGDVSVPCHMVKTRKEFSKEEKPNLEVHFGLFDKNRSILVSFAVWICPRTHTKKFGGGVELRQQKTSLGCGGIHKALLHWETGKELLSRLQSVRQR